MVAGRNTFENAGGACARTEPADPKTDRKIIAEIRMFLLTRMRFMDLPPSTGHHIDMAFEINAKPNPCIIDS
jgi:hypothetical protein